MTTVSFPGLGIKEFQLDSTAFKIPIGQGLEIKWYGIIITLGIILGFAYFAYRATRREGIKFDYLLDIAIFTIPIAIIGARLGYVLFSLDEYKSFLDVINIRGGGLQIYGGIIAGAATIFVVCKIKKISTLKILDAVAPGVMIGQIIGRWGNFMNGEAHGAIVEKSNPLYFLRMGLSPYYTNGAWHFDSAYVHPTFLYESIWNLVGFIAIHFLYKKKKFDGQIVLMYLSWYGLGRMMIESLRTDQLRILGVLPVSMVIGFICFVGGVLLLIVNLLHSRRDNITSGEYTPTYAKISHYGEDEEKEEHDEHDAETIDEDSEEIKSDAADEEPTQDTEPEDKDTITKRFNDIFKDEK